jgi:hypothetical protein
MRRSALVIAAALALAALSMPTPATAQLGIGARIGTLGLGADVTYGLTNRLALRGGIGVIPLEPEGDFTDVSYKIEPPSPLSTLGVDFYLTSGLRLIGGVLFGTKETDITAQYTGSVTVGGETYNGADVGDILGVVESSSAAPFAGIGLGKGLVSGLNLTFDFGVAFLKEPALTLTADGPLATRQDAQGQAFRASLEEERADIQEELEKYLKYYPIVNIAVRFGLGGPR